MLDIVLEKMNLQQKEKKKEKYPKEYTGKVQLRFYILILCPADQSFISSGQKEVKNWVCLYTS